MSPDKSKNPDQESGASELEAPWELLKGLLRTIHNFMKAPQIILLFIKVLFEMRKDVSLNDDPSMKIPK